MGTDEIKGRQPIDNKLVNLVRIFIIPLTIAMLLLTPACIHIVKPIDISFPSTTFSQTESITNTKMLVTNWTVTCINTIRWAPTTNTPRVALSFFSSLDDPGYPSIQLIEYNDGSLDIDKHDAKNQSGKKLNELEPLKWANPLKISLISDTLTVSSPAGTYVVSFPSFGLAYVTGGSTESDVCSGGDVDLKVEVITDPRLVSQ